MFYELSFGNTSSLKLDAFINKNISFVDWRASQQVHVPVSQSRSEWTLPAELRWSLLLGGRLVPWGWLTMRAGHSRTPC